MCGGGDVELTRLVVRSKDGTRQHSVRMMRIDPHSGTLVQPTLDLMIQHFIPREHMNSLLGFTSDPESITSLVDAWKQKISQGNCIAALPLDKDEVIAANITYIVEKNDEDFDSVRGGRAYSAIGHVLREIMESNDVCQKYGVDKYLSAMGLCVHPDYHGLGLGVEVLKAREPLCKILGVTCSATVFTSPISQGLADKAGFQTVYSKPCTDFTLADGQHPFQQAQPDRCLKLMARTYTF